MLREVDMKDISDGKLYGITDMVKADCLDCKGCHKCCEGMGTSIVLDPLDIMHLSEKTSKGFQEMIGIEIELNMVDGVILPNIKMGENDACTFLNEEGRCKIHEKRPGICRLFPLGRYYETNEKGERDFRYFLQTNECTMKNRAKVKVSKWIDTDNLRENQKFIARWHFFIKDAGEYVKNNSAEKGKEIIMRILGIYSADWRKAKDFYKEIENAIAECEKHFVK